MQSLKRFLALLTLLTSAGCGSTYFVNTWHDPSASLTDLRHQQVAAFLLSGNTAVRRDFESSLADQLTRHGIESLPGYEVLPRSDVTNKNQILKDLRRTPVDAAVFMRIVDQKDELTFVPDKTWYPNAYHDRFWRRHGRFYGPGFAGEWPPYNDSGYYEVDTVVSVESLVYSVRDSKRLFAGISKTVNPSEIDSFVKDLVSEAVKKLQKSGLVDSLT